MGLRSDFAVTGLLSTRFQVTTKETDVAETKRAGVSILFRHLEFFNVGFLLTPQHESSYLPSTLTLSDQLDSLKPVS